MTPSRAIQRRGLRSHIAQRHLGIVHARRIAGAVTIAKVLCPVDLSSASGHATALAMLIGPSLGLLVSRAATPPP